MVGNPSDSDFDDDSDASDFGEFDDEFDEYEVDVTSDLEESKLFSHIKFPITIDIGWIIEIFKNSWKDIWKLLIRKYLIQTER